MTYRELEAYENGRSYAFANASLYGLASAIREHASASRRASIVRDRAHLCGESDALLILATARS